VKTLPNRPGVYRMYDAAGDLLYVGKARDLKKRVSTYARGQGHSNRITMMLTRVARMEFATTATEAEALLLEANLIKKLKPRYNVLLRDDKSFPYILIDKEHPAPRLTKHRGARRKKGSYYGPFASAGAVNRALNAMEKAFLIRTCSDSVYANRTRPCLKHQIRRCSAPCTGEVSLEEHARLVRQAEDFLSGRSHRVQAELTRQMEEAAERLDFETAAILTSPPGRGSIRALSRTPTSSPWRRRAARPAYRPSSSAPGRTGETAPISRGRRRIETRRKSCPPSSPSSSEDLRSAARAASYRGLRQLPHSGNQRRWRHGRGRAGRLHEGALSQIQHPRCRPRSR